MQPLWSHQQEAIEFSDNKPGVMFSMEVGTGKTRAGIEWMKRRGLERVFVSAPAPGVNVWPKEMRKFYPDAPPVVVLQGDNRQQAAQMWNTRGPAVFVSSHRMTWAGNLKRLLMEKADKLDLDGIIADESQFMKTAGSQIGKVWNFLGNKYQNRLSMTGTLLHDKPIDAYGQMRFTDKRVFGTRKDAFLSRYVQFGGFQNRQILGYINQQEFMERLGTVTYWAYADEVLDLPPEIDIFREFELPASALRIYRDLMKDAVAEIGNDRYVSTGNILTKWMRLQQITSGFTVEDDTKEMVHLHYDKFDLLQSILEEAHEPVVVFGLFYHDLDGIRSITEKLGRTYGELSGRRDDLVDASYPPGVSVLGVQAHSGSAAVDLTASSLAIFFSMNYSLGDYRQCRGRVHRPGQEKTTRFIHLVAARTVDRRIFKTLQAKKDVLVEFREAVHSGIDLSIDTEDWNG